MLLLEAIGLSPFGLLVEGLRPGRMGRGAPSAAMKSAVESRFGLPIAD